MQDVTVAKDIEVAPVRTKEEMEQLLFLQEKRIAALEKRNNATDQALLDLVELVRTLEKNTAGTVLGAISNIFHGVAHQFDQEREKSAPALLQKAPEEVAYQLKEVDPVEQPIHIIVTRLADSWKIARSLTPDELVSDENAAVLIPHLEQWEGFEVDQTRYFLIVQAA